MSFLSASHHRTVELNRARFRVRFRYPVKKEGGEARQGADLSCLPPMGHTHEEVGGPDRQKLIKKTKLDKRSETSTKLTTNMMGKCHSYLLSCVMPIKMPWAESATVQSLKHLH